MGRNRYQLSICIIICMMPIYVSRCALGLTPSAKSRWCLILGTSTAWLKSNMSYYQHESAIIDEGAQIGAGSRIWHFAHVCAGAHYALMAGVPAKQIGWMSEYGEQIPLDMHGTGTYQCPHTGRHYTVRTLQDGQLAATGGSDAN